MNFLVLTTEIEEQFGMFFEMIGVESTFEEFDRAHWIPSMMDAWLALSENTQQPGILEMMVERDVWFAT